MATAISTIGGWALAPPPIITQELEPIKLEVFTSFPAWAMPFAAKDNRTAPLIRKGEVAVIETNGRTGVIPTHGGLYLIEYESQSLIEQCPHFTPTPDRLRRPRSWEIVQTCRSSHPSHKDRWYAHPYARTIGGRPVFVCSDGPYNDEYHLAEKILGPVVGIYAPQGLEVRS